MNIHVGSGRAPSAPACRFQERHQVPVEPRKCRACGSALVGSPSACHNIVCREQGKVAE